MLINEWNKDTVVHTTIVLITQYHHKIFLSALIWKCYEHKRRPQFCYISNMKISCLLIPPSVVRFRAIPFFCPRNQLLFYFIFQMILFYFIFQMILFYIIFQMILFYFNNKWGYVHLWYCMTLHTCM